MKISLSPSELRLLRLAIEIAISSEQDLIHCHTNRFTGKSIDADVTNGSKQTIRKLKALEEKLKSPTSGDSPG